MRGDEEACEVRTDCPAVAKQSLLRILIEIIQQSLRLLLTVAASKGYKNNSLDFKGAFLQGQPIEREVYLLPPSDVREKRPDMVWRVVKRLYGFRDSSRGWFMEFDSAMKKLGCVPVNTDNAMYVYKNAGGKIVGLAGVHVDDVLYTGEPEFHEKVIKVLLDKYVVRSVESELFTFIGWTLSQDKEGISLSQEHFLQQVDMSKFDTLARLRGVDQEPLNEALQGEYRSLVGRIQWIAAISRPDKAYYAVALASRLGKATVVDAKLRIKQLKDMRSNPQTIKFSALQDVEDCHLRSICDKFLGKVSLLRDSCGRHHVHRGLQRQGQCSGLAGQQAADPGGQPPHG